MFLSQAVTELLEEERKTEKRRRKEEKREAKRRKKIERDREKAPPAAWSVGGEDHLATSFLGNFDYKKAERPGRA